MIFAHGVLHHFENPDPLFAKITEILKEDGILVLTEPSTINPVFRFIRLLYRPFQSDADWEWPFTKNTVSTMEKYLNPFDGFGWGRRSLFASVFTSMPLIDKIAKPIYKYLLKKEINSGWNRNVWLNSTITAIYKKS